MTLFLVFNRIKFKNLPQNYNKNVKRPNKFVKKVQFLRKI